MWQGVEDGEQGGKGGKWANKVRSCVEQVKGMGGGREGVGCWGGVEERQVLGKEGAGLVEEGRGRAGQGCDGILPWRGPARHCVPSAYLSEREEWRALVLEAGNSWVRRAS